MTLKEFMHTPNPELDRLATEAETARQHDEDIIFEKEIKTMKTTMNSKYRVTAINGEVIDYEHEGINIITKHTCPDCGAIWYTYFEVYSFYEDRNAGTEPYEEWLYVSARCTACQPAARQNTYFFADKTHTLVAPTTYTLHVVTVNNAIDFTFHSIEQAKTVAELLWNDSDTDYITITNNNTTEVLYDATLPF